MTSRLIKDHLSVVDLSLSPFEFFKEQVCLAIEARGLSIPEEMEFYIVNLLCRFVVSTNLRLDDEELDMMSTPVALLYKRAHESPPEKQLEVFKAVGDVSLYMSGYFHDYFHQKSFSLDYFMGMGAIAYDAASHLKRERHRDLSMSELFSQLSEGFNDAAQIVTVVSNNLSNLRSSDLEKDLAYFREKNNHLIS